MLFLDGAERIVICRRIRGSQKYAKKCQPAPGTPDRLYRASPQSTLKCCGTSQLNTTTTNSLNLNSGTYLLLFRVLRSKETPSRILDSSDKRRIRPNTQESGPLRTRSQSRSRKVLRSVRGNQRGDGISVCHQSSQSCQENEN